MTRKRGLFRFRALLVAVTFTLLAVDVFAGTIRGRVDYQSPNGYYPLQNALVEVWGYYPNGTQYMMAWTRTDQWGFYYLNLPPYNGQVQVWVNKRVFQPIFLNAQYPRVDVPPILAR